METGKVYVSLQHGIDFEENEVNIEEVLLGPYKLVQTTYGGHVTMWAHDDNFDFLTIDKDGFAHYNDIRWSDVVVFSMSCSTEQAVVEFAKKNSKIARFSALWPDELISTAYEPKTGVYCDVCKDIVIDGDEFPSREMLVTHFVKEHWKEFLKFNKDNQKEKP